MDFLETINNLTDEQKLDLLVGKDNWNTQNYPELGISSVKMSDGPHGLRIEKPSKKHGLKDGIAATCFPTSSALATTWNTSLVEHIGTLMGEEAAFNKVQAILGPGINIKRNPLCGRNFEYYSEDPYLAGKLGAAMIRGIQNNGTIACVKHFAVNSQESGRMTVNAVVDRRALMEIYLTPFEIAIKEGGPKMLMTSYNRINGEYAHENNFLIGEVLRNRFLYDGVIVSDWGATNDITKSINAGSDLTMPFSAYHKSCLASDFGLGKIDRECFYNSVERILNLQKFSSKPNKAGESGVEYQYNYQQAVKACKESIVLLKNQNALPLSPFFPLTFIGDQLFDTTIQGGGSSKVTPNTSRNIADFVDDYDLHVVGKVGFESILNKKKKSNRETADDAPKDTAVVFFGYPKNYETEGKDRPNLSLPSEQISAYKSIRATFRKVVAVVISGSVVDYEPIFSADAILYVPYGGEGMPKAIMEVLTGNFCPSGKLSETIPISYNDVPTSTDFGDKFTLLYRESVFVGYRYYDKANVPVRFPFGHGLSYTEFEYSKLKVDKKGATFTIKNIGDYDGAEVCQLYIGKQETKTFRPTKELKGFVKVFLRKNEQKTVTIPFDEMSFRYYNLENDRYEREAGNYKIYIASSLEDIRLSSTVLISGTSKLTPKTYLKNYYEGKVKNVDLNEFENLYGQKIIVEKLDFIKKKRIKVNKNTTLEDLRFCKSFIGRIVGRHIYKKTLKTKKLSPDEITMAHMTAQQPLRSVASFIGYNKNQLNGLITLLNGKPFLGLKQIRKGKKSQ